MKVVGRREGLNNRIQKAIDDAEAKTAGGTRGQINMCINYGGRAEIVDGIQKIITQGKTVEEINEDMVSASLWTNGIPEPEMIVRTSGEKRLSGFLAWSGVYSELMFIDHHWPDFSVEDLDACLEEYQGRQRRYGV